MILLLFFFFFEHWWQVTYHSCSCSSRRFLHSFLPSYIYSDLQTLKHTVISFFKGIHLQAPPALQSLSITFYFTFLVWVHLEKTSQRRDTFQCQQEGYLHLAPCSGDCSGPLENLDWILWQDPHSIHGERSVFRRKKTIYQIIYLTVISDRLKYLLLKGHWSSMGAVKETLPGLHLDGSW